MALKLSIIQTDSDSPPKEVVFKTSHIKIGRHSQNDLCLKNPCLSRFHVEIIQGESDLYQIICLNNQATRINGQAPVSKEAFSLKQNDEISLPGYTIIIDILNKKKAPKPMERAEKGERSGDALIPNKMGNIPLIMLNDSGTGFFKANLRDKVSIKSSAKKLAFQLRQNYAEHFYESREEKVRSLTECIDQACRTISLPEAKKEILFFTNALFASSGQSKRWPSWDEKQKASDAFETIKKMAESLSSDLPRSGRKKDLERFGKHWIKLMEFFLRAFSDNMQFHQKMEKEFSEALVPSNRSPSNTIGKITSLKALSKHLLSWKKDDVKSTYRYLQEWIDFMNDRQKYLPHMIYESHLEQLKTLSPESIEKAATARENGHPVKDMILTKRQKIWNEYLKQHQELLKTMKKKIGDLSPESSKKGRQ